MDDISAESPSGDIVVGNVSGTAIAIGHGATAISLTVQSAAAGVDVQAYLAAVRTYCAHLPYLSLPSAGAAQTLAEVYVALGLRPRRAPAGSGAPEMPGPGPAEDEAREQAEAPSVSAAELLGQAGPAAIVIAGEGGTGKSTLLRHLAEHAWQAPAAIGLDAPHLPLLVPCRRLAQQAGAWETRLRTVIESELALPQELPPGFFDRWPDQTGARWLILLDALDEVPLEARPRWLQWLRDWLRHLAPHRVVLTTRPLHDLPPELAAAYELLPLTADQAGLLADRWAGERGAAFLAALKRLQVTELSNTPLLLTIAARVYLAKAALPERRSALYDQFVNICLAEAAQQGLKAELGERLGALAKPALAHLALAMTQDPLADTEAGLAQAAAAYLREALRLTPAEAGAESQTLLEVLARRSGVFVRRGPAYAFVHPTFREYLAAVAAVPDGAARPELAWQTAVRHAREADWRGVALFALGRLSEAGVEVTPLLRRLWPGHFLARGWAWLNSDWEGLYVAGSALAERCRVSPAAGQSIVRDLLTVRRFEALRVLGQLADWPEVEDALLAMASDNGSPKWFRLEAARLWGQFGRVPVILALAKDETVDPGVRLEAVRALGQRGPGALAGAILQSLARETGASGHVRWAAAEELLRLGQKAEAVTLLRALARQAPLFLNLGRVVTLWQLGGVEEARPALMRLARTQREAVRVLGQLDGPAAWRALTQDTTAAGYIRYEAACSLGRLGQLEAAVPVLLALAQDSKQLELRAEAALAAGEFGQKEAALAIVKEMLEDPKVYAHARCRAALAVGLLGQPETAMPILLELVNKKAELLSARSDAAEAVCRLGQAEAVILPLVAMAREEWIYDCGSGAPAGGASNSCEQIKALRILGQYAPADVLPALERMARQAVSRQVRQAAVDAVRQIRFRCAG